MAVAATRSEVGFVWAVALQTKSIAPAKAQRSKGEGRKESKSLCVFLCAFASLRGKLRQRFNDSSIDFDVIQTRIPNVSHDVSFSNVIERAVRQTQVNHWRSRQTLDVERVFTLRAAQAVNRVIAHHRR